MGPISTLPLGKCPGTTCLFPSCSEPTFLPLPFPPIGWAMGGEGRQDPLLTLYPQPLFYVLFSAGTAASFSFSTYFLCSPCQSIPSPPLQAPQSSASSLGQEPIPLQPFCIALFVLNFIIWGKNSLLYLKKKIKWIGNWTIWKQNGFEFGK